MGAAACDAAAVPVIAFRKEDPAWRDRSLRPARMGIATGNEDKGVHGCRMPL